jgi:hypothetical protein
LIALLLLLLAGSLVLPALIATVIVGQVLALLLWDRLATHEYRRVDRLVTEAEVGPENVIYLSDQIRADHRERRLMRLLERHS